MTDAGRIVRKLLRQPLALFGVLLVVAFVLGGLLAPMVAPFDPVKPKFEEVLLPPLTSGHLLGTDALGRDLFSRIIYGSRVSLAIGFLATGLAAVVGTLMGVVPGYMGGLVDTVVMRLVDLQLSFPFILLALTVNAVLGLELRNIVLTLVIVGWVYFARVVRGQVLALRSIEFVEAATSLGASPMRLIFRHVLPNVLTPVIVLLSLQMSRFIIAEASISFLGFGVQPPTPAWGNMLSEGRQYIFSAWWLTTMPGVALALCALGINLVGDWLRDVLDPQMRGLL